jgi:hypothetical protein
MSGSSVRWMWAPNGLQPGVECPDVGEVVFGELDARDLVAWADPGHHCLRLAGAELPAAAPGGWSGR